MFLFDHTMQYIKDIYREQFSQETSIKVQLASLSWGPPKVNKMYNMPTRDSSAILDNAIVLDYNIGDH